MTVKNTSFLDVCRGQKPARPPVWLMRQAGRYLPEYRAVRQKVSFLELCRNPELCAEVTVQPIDRLGVDAAILFSDILVVFDAMGVKVEFSPGPVIQEPVRTEAAAARLRFGDPAVELSYVMQGIKACKRALADRVPLIGFCGAPYTILSYLVEGGSTHEFSHIKGLIYREPVLFQQLMTKMTDLLANYLLAQIESGVDALQIFDSWAGSLPPAEYRDQILPHLVELVARVGGKGVPIILFVRGNANHLANIAKIDVDVLGIDWTIDLDRALEIVGDHRVIQGNLDPSLLLGKPELIRDRTMAMMKNGAKARGHIANLGHGILRYTDPEMAQLFIDCVHAY